MEIALYSHMTSVTAISGATLAGYNASHSVDSGGIGEFFGQLIDIVNPLQHIPVVSNFYRKLTGDEISGFAKIVGSGLFGGAMGAGMAIASEIANGGGSKDIQTAFAGNYEKTSNIASSSGRKVTTQQWLSA